MTYRFIDRPQAERPQGAVFVMGMEMKIGEHDLVYRFAPDIREWVRHSWSVGDLLSEIYEQDLADSRREKTRIRVNKRAREQARGLWTGAKKGRGRPAGTTRASILQKEAAA